MRPSCKAELSQSLNKTLQIASRVLCPWRRGFTKIRKPHPLHAIPVLVDSKSSTCPQNYALDITPKLVVNPSNGNGNGQKRLTVNVANTNSQQASQHSTVAALISPCAAAMVTNGNTKNGANMRNKIPPLMPDYAEKPMSKSHRTPIATTNIHALIVPSHFPSHSKFKNILLKLDSKFK